MTTNPRNQTTNSDFTLHMALELSASKWKLGFADRFGRRPRIRTIDAGDLEQLKTEITNAKKALGLDRDAPVCSCYEAGRDGFWLHRCLVTMGIDSHIVEPASIEMSRRKRRAKTDRIDAEKIVIALMRFLAGEKYACRMIRIPEVEAEDARNLNREMRTIKGEKTSHTNRIKSLLAAQGVTEVPIDRNFKQWLDQTNTPQGARLGPELKARLRREFDRLALAVEQVRELQMYQAALLRKAAESERAQLQAERRADRLASIAHHLSQLGGIGPVSSWTLAAEIFSWRDIKNRRQLAALAGLTPTPHASGGEEKEQGISKAGRGEIRSLLIEVGWGWLQYQPQSELSRWYRHRFGDGTRRNKKRGIVALARKLLVALGKYVRDGVVPAGARLTGELKYNYLASLRPKHPAAT